MSKVVKCREVGVDCDFEARGETEQEVLQKCAEHAKNDHGMNEIPPELAAKVKSAIHDELRRLEDACGFADIGATVNATGPTPHC
ncbi:MAG: DUF1059 domain-containing protein [Acidobacteriaceae bacterium]|nr:DUF1059 domain-containing protein [Acidobacteriaceae bacterium]